MQQLDHILNQFGAAPVWDQQRSFQYLLQAWPILVGETVAAHSRPLGIQRQVLQVATSAAVWAQNLSFERQRLLTKLNQNVQLRSLNLKDIRFSTAQWHNSPTDPARRLQSQEEQLRWQQHPSRLPPAPEDSPLLLTDLRPTHGFQRWAERQTRQNQALPLCPRCQCPTPGGELKRWSQCAFCATQKWQADMRANQPNGA